MAAERSRPRRLVLAGFLLVALPRGLAAAESCTTCHPQAKTAVSEGVHAPRFGCTGCHGGDPDALDVGAHSAERGFVGIPPRQEVPKLCARCHADPGVMKPFGLPTDQYAQYQTSGHGMALERGNTQVAVCTDCHGHHGILETSEPTSPVSRWNVVATCAGCHSDRARMAPFGLPTDQEEQFRRSVHGVALYESDHPIAPSCADCHGAHGATAMGGSPSAACGHCHERTREYFELSPHRAAVAAGKMSICVSCHGDHEIVAPARGLFDDACRRCHAPETTAYAVGQNLKTLLGRAAESLDTAGEELAEGKKRSPTLARFETYLLQGRAYFMEALPVQHSLDVEKVEDLTRSARSVAEDVRSSIHGVAYESRVRYLVLAVAWMFLLFAALVAYLYWAELRRRRNAGPDRAAPG